LGGELRGALLDPAENLLDRPFALEIPALEEELGIVLHLDIGGDSAS
jgi:hypothetical protein